MAKVRITPDTQLATPEAIRIRIAQLESEQKTTQNSTDLTQLERRIKALQERMVAGSDLNIPRNASLLKSKRDLE